MARKWIALATSLCALAIVPATAAADGGKGGGPLGTLIKQAQTATNENKTEQSASSDANSEQINVNAPVAVMSPGSDNGHVDQSNEAETISASQNNNETAQVNGQSQQAGATGKGAGEQGSCGCASGGGQQVEQDQQAANSNSTEQQASSQAHSKQVNVNAPVAVMSPGSDNGHVDQSNQAQTVAASQNNNSTEQGNFQNQEANVAGGGAGGSRDSCGCKDGKSGDGGQKVDQSQQASNSNETSQNAESSATNEQKNINKGGSQGQKDQSPWPGESSCGCSGGGEYGDAGKHHDHPKGDRSGEVNQSNQADTVAASQNNNETAQGNFQNQEANAAGGGIGAGQDSCVCKDGKSGDGGQKVDQSQQASNSNDTSQNAESSATNEQKNINKPGSPQKIDSLGPPQGPPGPPGGEGLWSPDSGGNTGNVSQSNLAETLSLSQNNNETAQGNFQNQEGSIL